MLSLLVTERHPRKIGLRKSARPPQNEADINIILAKAVMLTFMADLWGCVRRAISFGVHSYGIVATPVLFFGLLAWPYRFIGITFWFTLLVALVCDSY